MIKERINALRQEMQKEKIDYYIIPTSDFHQSEYVGDYFKCREYVSGFTGSSGTLVVSGEEAGLWTDGRYYLQAESQLKGTDIELFRSGSEGVPSIEDYLYEKLLLSQGRLTIGFDGRVIDIAWGRRLERRLLETPNPFTIRHELDLVDRIWTDRPAMACNPVYILEEKYSGRSALDKLTAVRNVMKENDCRCHVLTSLDDIAWLLNLRGNDVACNPVFLSYLIVEENSCILFINRTALSQEVLDYLNSLQIKVCPYNEIYDYFYYGKILLNEGSINYSLYKSITTKAAVVNRSNPTTLMKAVKNQTETDNIRQANITDGIAMVKFLFWLDSNRGKIPMTELSISDKLLEFRRQCSDFMDVSFETISGYGSHAAIVHYEPTPDTDIPIEARGFLLIDSGAQYKGGTTDITRTLAMGPLTDDMKKHYTAVLKGNLALAAVHFPAGIAGANLDVLARRALWEMGLDYNHGTGHGLGCFLNVHEGPHNIHWRIGTRKSNTIPLEPGMLITDEPGIYIAGSHGIRTENDLLVVEDITTEYGKFYRFEILTLCPIDKKGILPELLTTEEKNTLNTYHQRVYDLLSPYLEGAELKWLQNACEAI